MVRPEEIECKQCSGKMVQKEEGIYKCSDCGRQVNIIKSNQDMIDKLITSAAEIMNEVIEIYKSVEEETSKVLQSIREVR